MIFEAETSYVWSYFLEYVYIYIDVIIIIIIFV